MDKVLRRMTEADIVQGMERHLGTENHITIDNLVMLKIE
jgi:hypothetical protein